jgi:hypothetical protein
MYFPSIQVVTPVYTIESDELLDGFVVIISAVWILGRMLLVAAVVGVSVTVTATEHVDVWLVISGTAGWSFVPVLQLGTGLVLIRGARLPLTSALDRYFATGWPWSLWILTAHTALLLIPWLRGYSFGLLATVAIPIWLTFRLLVDVCQRDLGMPRRAAMRRVTEHQALTYTLIVLYVQISVALWPRIVGVLS